jgi:uncharacterized membrane protein YvlD (DUF360 family)
MNSLTVLNISVFTIVWISSSMSCKAIYTRWSAIKDGFKDAVIALIILTLAEFLIASIIHRHAVFN